MPVLHGSVTFSAAAIATLASAALPPECKILAPISDTKAFELAATPCKEITGERLEMNENFSMF
jgi:hypothetical protein